MPVDLLNPLATIQWKQEKEIKGVWSTTPWLYNVIQQKRKLMILTSRYNVRTSSLWEFSCDFSSWKQLSPLPCGSPGFSTYHSQLVLVGGKLPSGGFTNKVWVSDDGYSWNTSLPPMPTERAWPAVVNTGTPEYLIVAGGLTTEVEVLMDGQWWTAESLPCRPLYNCGHIIHNGNLYLQGFGCTIMYSNLQALLASCNSADSDSLWSVVHTDKYPRYLVSFQKQLLCFTHNTLLASYNESLVAIGTAEYYHHHFLEETLNIVKATDTGIVISSATMKGMRSFNYIIVSILLNLSPVYSVLI